MQRCDMLGRQIIHCHSVLTATASNRSTTEGCVSHVVKIIVDMDWKVM